MKKLILFAALAAFASCSSDDPINEPQPVSMKNKLKSHVMKSSYGTLFDLKYEYNDLGYVSEVTAILPYLTETYRYSYQGDKLITVDHDRGGDDYYSIFTYEGDLIVQELISNNGKDVLVKYDYNTNGELIKKSESTVEKEFPESEYTFFITEYSYTNGNVVREISTVYDYNNQPIDVYEYTFHYDNYNHPTTLTFPESYRKIKLEGKNNDITRYHADYAIDLKYNSDNYPVLINDYIRVQYLEYFE